MSNQKKAPKVREPSFEERQLDFIKYNLYLLFKAVCCQVAQAQQNPGERKDLASIILEGEKLAQLLDKQNVPPTE